MYRERTKKKSNDFEFRNNLAMLYSNAKDKNKFMDELTDYVFRVINKTVVKESIAKLFEEKQTTPSGINFTEIHE